MAILQITTEFAGQVGVIPRLVRVWSDDDYDTISAEGYLNAAYALGITIQPTDFIFMTYDGGFGTFNPEFSGQNITLKALPASGNVDGDLTVLGNVQAGESGGAGYFISYPATAAKGYLAFQAVDNTDDYAVTVSNAAMGQASVISIPDPGASTANFILSKSAGTQHLTSGGLQVDAGSFLVGLAAGGSNGSLTLYPTTTANGSFIIQALNAGAAFNTTVKNSVMGQSSVISIPDPGSATADFIISKSAGTQTISSGNLTVAAGNVTAGASGAAGYLASFSSTAARGSLRLVAVANTGDTLTTISNAAMGQASVISIPDPGAATANFLLDAGTANTLTDFQKVIGINNILIASVGTWTRTRIAQGDYVLRHTAADDTSVIGIDITEALRTTASKGLRLASIDFVYSIGTLALDAHTVVLDRIAYANNVAVAVTSVPLTGSLSTATQANPYVTNIAVTTPAFLNTADAKYVIELTVDAAATSAYDFYGVVLRFSQTIA